MRKACEEFEATQAPLPGAEFGLSPAQYVFVTEWLSNGFNGLQAYKASHPAAADSTARVEAQRYLLIPAIRKFIVKWFEEELGPLEASGKEIRARVGAASRASIKDFYDQEGKLLPVHKWPNAAALAVKSFDGEKLQLMDRQQLWRLVLELTGEVKSEAAAAGDAIVEAFRATMEEARVWREAKGKK